jgi:hypothetical protein
VRGGAKCGLHPLGLTSVLYVVQRMTSQFFLSPALHLPVSARVMAATARLAGCFPRSLLCPDTWTMLAQGNVADATEAAASLERPLRDPADFAAPGEAERLRLRAFAFWRASAGCRRSGGN